MGKLPGHAYVLHSWISVRDPLQYIEIADSERWTGCRTQARLPPPHGTLHLPHSLHCVKLHTSCCLLPIPTMREIKNTISITASEHVVAKYGILHLGQQVSGNPIGWEPSWQVMIGPHSSRSSITPRVCVTRKRSCIDCCRFRILYRALVNVARIVAARNLLV